MKLLSAEQTRWLDAYTIQHEPVSSIDLMERAAKTFTYALLETINNRCNQIHIFCGPGNNGGDGFAIARLLHQQGKKVSCYLLPCGALSPDCKTNHERFATIGNVHTITDISDFPVLSKDDCVVDALYGSGLNRPLSGLVTQLISHINQQPAKVFAVDMPSGLYADTFTDAGNAIIKADYTFTFQAPKVSFLLPFAEPYTGKWKVLDIGLSKDGEQSLNSGYFLTDSTDVAFLKTTSSKHAHKGIFGHALICAGSYGMMGAAVLSTQAALRSGCGLVTASVPAIGYNIMQSTCPEAMVLAGQENVFSLPDEIAKYNAIAVGPGLGTGNKAVEQLNSLLELKPRHLVVDADALNVIAANKALLTLLPPQTIITPHPGEFKRLAGTWQDDFEKLELLKTFSNTHQLIVVLKGAHTIVASPDGQLFFNNTGNNGMAKGGSGDVLTGVVISLLAQSYTPLQTAIAAVHVHGLAGDIALKEKGRFGMNASDIIKHLPQAFRLVAE